MYLIMVTIPHMERRRVKWLCMIPISPKKFCWKIISENNYSWQCAWTPGYSFIQPLFIEHVLCSRNSGSSANKQSKDLCLHSSGVKNKFHLWSSLSPLKIHNLFWFYCPGRWNQYTQNLKNLVHGHVYRKQNKVQSDKGLSGKVIGFNEPSPRFKEKMILKHKEKEKESILSWKHKRKVGKDGKEHLIPRDKQSYLLTGPEFRNNPRSCLYLFNPFSLQEN